MKKILVLFLALIGLTTLVACNPPKDENIDRGLMISKYYSGVSMRDNVIELYNYGEETLNLSGYKVELFSVGSSANRVIELTGELKKGDFFVIANTTTTNPLINARATIKGPLDYRGNTSIGLLYNDLLLDLIWPLQGWTTNLSELTLIRNHDNFKNNPEFNLQNFIWYKADVFEYLKNFNYEIKTYEDLMQGPRLEESYKRLSFADANGQGEGGAVSARVVSVADGDTATFYSTQFNFNSAGTRFLGINTPESTTAYNMTYEQWGVPASWFTKYHLQDKPGEKEIFVQSQIGGSVREQNSRTLGYIWVDGYCLNFILAANGFAKKSFSLSNRNETSLTYKNVIYLQFMEAAFKYAETNELRLFGQNDPYWDYDRNVIKEDRSFRRINENIKDYLDFLTI